LAHPAARAKLYILQSLHPKPIPDTQVVRWLVGKKVWSLAIGCGSFTGCRTSPNLSLTRRGTGNPVSFGAQDLPDCA